VVEGILNVRIYKDMENEKNKNTKSTKKCKMKKVLLLSIITIYLAQVAFAVAEIPQIVSPSYLLESDNEKTKMVREGGATMRGDNQKKYELPELFDKKKIVMKPAKRSIEQQVWEDFSYPTPRFVTD
jgi:hypothetical protein